MGGKGFFDELLEALRPAADFFEERGINPVAGMGFVLLVLAGVAFLLLSQQSSAELKTVVLSSGELVEGARVQLFSQEGKLIATGVTSEGGQIVFSKKIPSSGRVTLKVSKEGFVAADGSAEAVAVVDLSRRKSASIELYSSEVAGGEIGDGITFTVLDSLSRQPIQSASLSIAVGSRISSLSTDGQGRVFLAVGRGESIKIKISAANYFPDTRSFTAIRGEETILLSPRISDALSLGGPGELPKINAGSPAGSSDAVVEEASSVQTLLFMPEAIVRVKDGSGNDVQSGLLQLVSATGQVIATSQVSNGVAKLSSLPVSPEFSIIVSGTQSGTVSVIDPTSNAVLFSASLQNGVASFSPTPRSTLGVSVRTSSGEAVQTGVVRVHDAASNALLGEFSLFNGFALVQAAIAANTRIKLVLDAAGFSAPPVESVFGRDSSASITAAAVGAGDLRDTVFRSQGEAGPVSTQLRVFRQAEPTPVFEGIFSGAKIVSLQTGLTYSAVFSSPGRYSYTFQSFQAGSTLDAVLPVLGANLALNQCVSFEGTQSCVPVQFSPENSFVVSVIVSDAAGAPVEGASVAVRDSAQRTLAAQSTNPAGRVSFASLPAGDYELVASLAGFSASKPVIVSADASESILLELFGTLLLSATSMQGGSEALQVSFAAEGGPSCSGRSCSLQVPANRDVKIKASAAGHSAATVVRRVSPGELLPTSFELVSSSALLEIKFRSLRDSLGRPVSSVLAGQDYFAEFSIYSSGEFDETTAAIRLGEASSVREQGYGIIDFQPPAGFFAVKSTSYSQPQPVCVDDNNGNHDNGLLKSARLSFENKGGELHRLVSIPVRVKDNAVEQKLKLFYRIEGREGAAVTRIPFDAALGTEASVSSRAGCYAESLSAEVAIALSNTCRDFTARGFCSPNSPLSCSPSLALSADAGCCPVGSSLANGLCSPDNTLEGQCSATNKPFIRQNGQLAAAPSCCPAERPVFELVAGRAVCRSKGASCQIASRVFEDGDCLPTPPGRCLDGLQQPDSSACGAASGKCVDGTSVGQCSLSPGNFLKKCVSSVQQNQLVDSADCRCPAGTKLVAGACQTCAASDCGETASTCLFNGVRYNSGCISGSPPFECTANGISSNPASCGCAAGQEFNSATSSCSQASTQACGDGTPAFQCSSRQPLKCAAVGGQFLLVPDANSCRCPPPQISDGVGCRQPEPIQPGQQQGQPTPTPTVFPAVTPIPTPIPQACSPAVACLSPDQSDSYCTNQATLSQSCLICNAVCGGSGQHACDVASGRCTALRCAKPFPSGTPAGQCVEGGNGERCSIVSGSAVVEVNPGLCPCRPGFKPAGGECMACATPDCQGEQNLVCGTFDGQRHAVGCLPSKYSSTFGDAGAEPIKKCEPSGSVLPAVVDCGCPAPYMRTFDGTACIKDPAATPPPDGGGQPPLPTEVTCPGCTTRDTVLFNRVTGQLATRSGKKEMKMRADTFFPADGLPIDVDISSTRFKISLQELKSASHSESCYRYDAQNKLLVFKAVTPCPIEVRANKFFHTVENKEVTSDSIKLVFRHESVPPQELELTVTVELASLESIHVQPLGLQGPDTPQLVYLINNKQTAFGPRTLQIAAKTTDNNQMQGAGVKVLAWRGPGTMLVSEKTVPLSTLSYERVASYFVCTGETGPRVEQATGPFDCAGGWCNGQAFHQMFGAFQQYAGNIWQQTAARRGNAQPFASVAPLLGGELRPFEVFTAAQVIDGSGSIVRGHGITLSSFEDCSNSVHPGIFSIRGTTTDGNFRYDAKTAVLHKFDYVDGVCPDDSLFNPAADPRDAPEQHLCDYLYGGQCACIYRSKHSNFATQRENKDGNSFMNMLPFLLLLMPLFQKLLGGLGKGGMGGMGGMCGEGGMGGCGPNGCGGPAGLNGIGSGLGAGGVGQSAAKEIILEGVSSIPRLEAENNFEPLQSPSLGDLPPPNKISFNKLDEIPASKLEFQGGGGAVGAGAAAGVVGAGGAGALQAAAALFCQLQGAGLGPASNINSMFHANEFGVQCKGLDNSYQSRRQATNAACGPSKRRPNGGARQYWVDPVGGNCNGLTANAQCTVSETRDYGIFIGLACVILPCTATGPFQMTPRFGTQSGYENTGDLLDALDGCEDEGGYVTKNGARTVRDQCADKMNRLVRETQTRINADIDAKQAACISSCTTTANAFDGSCPPCLATAGQACITNCQQTAVHNKQQLQERLSTCQQEMLAELDAGSNCEKTSKDLIETPTSPFNIGPTRMLWATCQSNGVTNGDDSNPSVTARTKSTEDAPGHCTPVVQEAYSWVQLGVKANRIVLVNRWGVGAIGPPSGDPTDRPPALQGIAALQTPNTLPGFVAAGSGFGGAIGGLTPGAVSTAAIQGATIGAGVATFVVQGGVARPAAKQVAIFSPLGSPFNSLDSVVSFSPLEAQSTAFFQGPTCRPGMPCSQTQFLPPPGTDPTLTGLLRPQVPPAQPAPAANMGNPFDAVPPSPQAGQLSGTGRTAVFDQDTQVTGNWPRDPFPEKKSLFDLRQDAARGANDQHNTQPAIQNHDPLAGSRPPFNRPPNPRDPGAGSQLPPGTSLGDQLNPQQGGQQGGGGGGQQGQQNQMQDLLKQLSQMLQQQQQPKQQGQGQQQGQAAFGSACSSGADCASGSCLTPEGGPQAGQGYCTQACGQGCPNDGQGKVYACCSTPDCNGLCRRVG